MSPEIKNYIDLAGSIVDFSKSKGADQSQVSIGRSTNFSVEIRDGVIEKMEEASSTSLSLKVIVDDKVATSSSSDLSPDTLRQIASNAIERARYGGRDTFAALPEKEELKVKAEDLNLYDPKMPEITPEFKINFARKLEEICKRDSRIKLSNGSYFGTSIGDSILVNSLGFSGAYSTSSCYSGVTLQAGESDNMHQDGWYENSIRISELMSPEEIARIAIHRATRLIGAKKIESQSVPIVFEPSMASSLLAFLAGCLNGRSIYMNRSFLSGKLGQKIGADIVNIIDDATIPGSPGSRPFDSEGVPARKLQVVTGGTLNSYLLDTYSARKLGSKSTGHASGTSNFFLVPGNLTQEEIIRSVDKGLLLTNTIGQGTVATTGDISKGAYGIWIEKGVLSHPVSEITISGNLGDILKNIEMIGNDPEKRRSVSAPTIKVNGMTISGK